MLSEVEINGLTSLIGHYDYIASVPAFATA
ncbi:hypothetical protein IMCC3317_04660 [Kordia antarctica]|uniref:Uncharacterized protein n=1 Tax=Kordia antarctica TaxID=1218801 RepID=A0A7L4ZF33_9FLAO|nr:hypothetical protein IMCC3317_04660 [Kordia antarctica]